MSYPFFAYAGSFYFKMAVVAVLLLVFTGKPLYAQFWYPEVPRVERQKENALQLVLKTELPAANNAAVLLELGNIYFYKPLKKTADLKRSKQYVEQALAIYSREVKLNTQKNALLNARQQNALLLLADLYCSEDSLQMAADLLKKVDEAGRLKLHLLLSFKYWLRDVDYKQDDYAAAIGHANDAIVLSKKLHDVKSGILALQYLAMVHGSQQKPEAEKELLRVLRFYQLAREPRLHYIYYLLSQYYGANGGPDKRLLYSLRAISSMKKTGDSIAAGDIYTQYAAVLEDNDAYAAAIAHGQLALQRYKENAGMYYLVESPLFEVMQRSLRKQKKYREALQFVLQMKKQYPPDRPADQAKYDWLLGHSYRELKDYRRAENHLLRALRTSEQTGSTSRWIISALGQTYLDAKLFEKSRHQLNKLLTIPKDRFFLSELRHAEYMAFLADSASGHYLEAIRHHNMYNSIDNIKARTEIDKELQKLNVTLETQKKTGEIRLLKQQSKLGEAKLREANLIRNMTMGGLALLLIIIGLLYYQYRRNQRSSKVIAVKNEVITHKNAQLEHLLIEKEWLLKEVHHRVKNNLHTIFCLLESQAVFLKDDALKAVEKSQHRIYAMSLVHQKLYLSGDIKTVDMQLYFSEFLSFLSDSYGLSDQVRIVQDVQPLKLGVALAIPLALILNEAVTNSIKYAFPDNRTGEILVRLCEKGDKSESFGSNGTGNITSGTAGLGGKWASKNAEGTAGSEGKGARNKAAAGESPFGEMELLISDNGIGMPDLKEEEYLSLGIELIRGLSKEIGAKVEFITGAGTTIRLTFLSEPDLLDEF